MQWCAASRRSTNFYPRPPRGGRRRTAGAACCSGRFLSTPSARRATALAAANWLAMPISIHALREEGDLYIGVTLLRWSISIHALREEGDPSVRVFNALRLDFYPRPPRGGRLDVQGGPDASQTFLSTPSARRATADKGLISMYREFLSTPSARRATSEGINFFETLRISIHALREEGDDINVSEWAAKYHFYPRPPRGGRPANCAVLESTYTFLSTPSARRATACAVAIIA